MCSDVLVCLFVRGPYPTYFIVLPWLSSVVLLFFFSVSYRQAGVNNDPAIATIFSNFVDMLAAILFMDTNVACLTRIFKVL